MKFSIEKIEWGCGDLKHNISKAQYEALMRKLEQMTIIVDGRRKIVIYQRRDENADIPKN
ncbi:hypothetical protein [Thermococcus indicus]|uniref:hypothetical protein n=1 Tax=Thermococcus indicus TaxID=2586643 RepID=UPI00143DB324|nr:hypothetical protein [Thermococcus indicus]